MHAMASFEIYPVTGESRCASSLISTFNYSFQWRMTIFHVRKIPESVHCLNLHIPMVLTCYLNCLFNKAVCSYVSEGKDISRYIKTSYYHFPFVRCP